MREGTSYLRRRLYSKQALVSDSPSRRAGLSWETEEEHRRAYSQLLLDVGRSIGLCVSWAVRGLGVCGLVSFARRPGSGASPLL